MTRNRFIHAAVLCIVLCAPPFTAAGQQARPGTWAKPVGSEHLRNFYKLDDKVYRSAQPYKKGFRELERLGITNVLNLRDNHSDDGKAGGTKLRLFRVEMDAGRISDKQVLQALHIINNAEGPLLIHCWHGSDRTGLVSAMYRIVFQNWTKEDAIDEFMHGGYGYHSIYKNIPEYIRNVDIDKVRRSVFADRNPLLNRARKYRERVDRTESSAEKTSIHELIREGASLADELRPVMESLSTADYDVVKINMKGFLINRKEVIVAEPDASFFAELAEQHGTEDDKRYFQFLREARPEGFWPVYIMPQTDFGGCTRYGEGLLADLHKKGKALLPGMTGYYETEMKKQLADISDQLTTRTCACGDRQSVIRELNLFLKSNKDPEIAEKVRRRLEDVQKQRSTMRYHCVGGL